MTRLTATALTMMFLAHAHCAVADVTLPFTSVGSSVGSIKDAAGKGAYFTTRMPSTGSSLAENDVYLNLAPVSGCLRITSTRSNLEYAANGSQLNHQAEAPGMYLTDVANQDVCLSAVIRGIHVPEVSDQFMLYFSDSTGKHVRAGCHMSAAGPQFTLAANQGGWDDIKYSGPVNAFAEGNDLLLKLCRSSAQWKLTWNNLTTGTQGSSGSYAIPWLDTPQALTGGLWYGNPTNDNSKTSYVDRLRIGRGDAGVTLDFDNQGSILDTGGKGASFSTRLPGTGGSLAANDSNLSLAPNPGRLTVTSTRSNLEYAANGAELNHQAEAPGMLLTNAANRDIKVAALIRDIHLSEASDQLDLYVSDPLGRHIRAGGHVSGSGANPRQFALTSNQGGWDAKEFFGATGAFSDGDDVSMILTRTAGEWQLHWKNETTGVAGSSGTFTASWLDNEATLYAGIWYGNPTNDNSKTSQIDWFSADVVPEPSTWAILGIAWSVGLLVCLHRRRAG